jgi:hypothetical protein
MLYFIVFLVILLSIFKLRYKLKTLGGYYKKYKNFVDPENKHGHFYTIKSVFAILYSVYQVKNIKKEEPEKFNKKYIKISYKYKDKKYFYLLKVPRGVNPIKQITDENDNDIHDIIYPYLGPNLDCHGSILCPKDFGYEKIKITTIFDKLIIFDEDQKIDLTD